MKEVISKILDQKKSYEDADFLPRIFGGFLEDATSGNIPVVLFGAGSAGKELYPIFKNHGIDPVCFCDNNTDVLGKPCCGLKTVSPGELINDFKGSLVVITTACYFKEIKAQLISLEFSDERILCIEEGPLFHFYSLLSLCHWTGDELVSKEAELDASYNLLSDEKSRQFFIKYLSLLTDGSDYKSFCDFIRQFSEVEAHGGNVNETYLYFNTDIIDLNNNEVLVDCGSYDGDSAIEFIKACKKSNVSYKHIYCFEPEPALFLKLSQNINMYQNIKAINLGLWTHSTTLSFVNTEIEKPGATRIIRDNGDIHFSDEKNANAEVQVTSIDDQFPNEKVSFIKMDIEGSEIEAIRGAENTIRKCKPKLAISIYHKQNDIFEVPLLIHDIYPHYKFYLRQLSNSLSETVIFAIP